MATACEKTPAVVTPQPSAEESPIPSSDVTPTPEGEYPIIAEAGSTVKADLNGDGNEDEIFYKTDEDGYLVESLEVNGVDYKDSIEEQVYIDSPESAYYCITDLDTTDNMLEIALMDYGPSSDYATHFFRYDGEALKYLGNVSGMIISSFSDESDLTFNGDGTITSYVRLSVMQTWFAGADWVLTDSGFELAPRELYYPNSEYGCNVTLITSIPVYDDNSTDSNQTVLTEGTAMKVLATDNLEWVLAELTDGTKCWVHLEPESFCEVETTAGYDLSNNVFDGLCMAD